MLNIPATLLSRMKALGIRPGEMEEHFVRSAGSGGQNVNKVSTCVRLTHVPTGITVKCMTHRTQAKNRSEALARLLARIEARRRERVRAERETRERARRRNRPRPVAVKRRLLEEKRRRSEKKNRRRPPDTDGG